MSGNDRHGVVFADVSFVRTHKSRFDFQNSTNSQSLCTPTLKYNRESPLYWLQNLTRLFTIVESRSFRYLVFGMYQGDFVANSWNGHHRLSVGKQRRQPHTFQAPPSRSSVRCVERHCLIIVPSQRVVRRPAVFVTPRREQWRLCSFLQAGSTFF